MATTAKTDENLREVTRYIKEFMNPKAHVEEVSAILQEVLASNGKMIRPALVLYSGQYAREMTPYIADKLNKVSALVELVHVSSLIHDDIIDDSPLRRGLPTIQSRYGKKVAVYAGDYLYSQAIYQLMTRNFNVSGSLIASTVQQMCAGEIIQTNNRFNLDISVGKYLECIGLKTASLISAACRIGAIESGADKTTTERLASIGYYIGMMFQLRDDLLDFTADEEKIGKPVLVDCLSGIYTLPIIYALKDPLYGKKLADLLTAGNVKKVKELIIISGGDTHTKKLIDYYCVQAKHRLSELPMQTSTLEISAIIDKCCL